MKKQLGGSVLEELVGKMLAGFGLWDQSD